MTKGQIEAKISEAVSRFEIEHMGRGPKQIRTVVCQDLIIIRLQGFLSLAERNLAQNPQGVELLKQVRTALFENAKDTLEDMVRGIVDVGIISVHSDVSTRTGEKMIVITLDENLEESIHRLG